MKDEKQFLVQNPFFLCIFHFLFSKTSIPNFPVFPVKIHWNL
jgi:hypothetical protein